MNNNLFDAKNDNYSVHAYGVQWFILCKIAFEWIGYSPDYFRMGKPCDFVDSHDKKTELIDICIMSWKIERYHLNHHLYFNMMIDDILLDAIT